ncbi:MAG TPA: hypothetical protein VIG54_11005 [Lysobacter sp.]
MTRTVIALALTLALSTAASADPVPRTVGDATPGAFTVETFGEAAERVQIAGKPLHMRVRTALPLDRVSPVEPSARELLPAERRWLARERESPGDRQEP